MKKIAIAMLLLAGTTFGATLTISDGVVSGGSATVTMSVQLGANERVDNFSIFSDGTQPQMDKLTWTGRTILPTAGLLTDVQTAVTNTTLAADPGFIDFGMVKTSAGVTGTGKVDLCTLTFAVANDAKLPLPVTFNYGTISGSAGSGLDLPNVTFTILTPEPASMLLLAAGAAFFARRRRA